MNNVNLIGRLTKEVDLKITPNGNAAARFILAVERHYTNAEGKREADFIPVISWRKLAENVGNYCGKGSLVGVTGKIETRAYDNKDGKKVYVTEVIANEIKFLSQKNNNENRQQNKNQNKTNANPFAGSQIDISDDDLPF